MQNTWLLKPRLSAAGIHLLISAFIAASAGALVFGLWYPNTYRLLAGGQSLFLLIVSVDVVLGPLLTFVVFDRSKGWRHLRRDLAVIGLVQLTGLIYGLHTVYIARPIAMVFEMDRFRVVTAADVYLPELPQALPQYRRLPLTGPWLLSIRDSQLGKERNDALFMAVLNGIDTGQRPLFWRPYSEATKQVIQKARPISALIQRYPAKQSEIETLLRALQLSSPEARFVPVIARGDWVAVLNAQGDVRGFLQLDGFF